MGWISHVRSCFLDKRIVWLFLPCHLVNNPPIWGKYAHFYFVCSQQATEGSASQATTAQKGHQPWRTAHQASTARPQACPLPLDSAMLATTALWAPHPPPKLSAPSDTSVSRVGMCQTPAGMERTDLLRTWLRKESARIVTAVAFVMEQDSAASLGLAMQVRVWWKWKS